MPLIESDLEQYMLSRGQLITSCLDKLVPEKNVPYNQLFQAARYSLMSGGKRVRPILALAVTESLNGSADAALIPVCALEMVHTYSMIHDDLPCMDNDDFRRGKPTLHRVFPEGHALLAGDFLLTHAFGIIAHSTGLSAEQKVQLTTILASFSGGDGMIAGQIMDIEAEKKDISMDDLRLIHQCKTGALIEASTLFGAVMANADEEMQRILALFGKNIGLAFQIIDDILDVTSSTHKHGKGIASDIINGKKTYPSLLGIEKSQDMAHDLLNNALDNLKQLPFNTYLLSKLATFIVNRKN